MYGFDSVNGSLSRKRIIVVGLLVLVCLLSVPFYHYVYQPFNENRLLQSPYKKIVSSANHLLIDFERPNDGKTAKELEYERFLSGANYYEASEIRTELFSLTGRIKTKENIEKLKLLMNATDEISELNKAKKEAMQAKKKVPIMKDPSRQKMMEELTETLNNIPAAKVTSYSRRLQNKTLPLLKGYFE